MKKLGMDEKELKELYELMSRSFVISLDEVISLEEGEVERGALIPDSSPSPEEVAESNDEHEKLKSALEKLPQKKSWYYRFIITKDSPLRRLARHLASLNQGYLKFTAKL